MGALRSRHDIPIENSISDVRKQIDNVRFLALKYVLSFGADKPEEYSHYFKVMSDAAAYAADKGIRDEASWRHQRGFRRNTWRYQTGQSPNFSIWYDAGNIIYYTGKDPVAEMDPIAKHVTGFCAKDCAEPKGDVMIQFGTGKVDFAAVFKKLKSAGFEGPVMMECCKVGQTPEETTGHARANREFLERVMASL